MTNMNNKRLAVLTFRTAAAAGCLLAALAAPALAEADDHRQPQASGRVVDVYDEFNRGPYGYNPEPVHGQQPIYAPPVHAQPAYTPPVHAPHPGAVAYAPVLNENQIRQALRRQGYRRVGDIAFADTDFGRGRYTARARDQRNRPVLLVVSAQTGQVLDQRFLR